MTLRRALLFCAAVFLSAGQAAATRIVVEPISDADDGQLINEIAWDSRLGQATVPDLLLTVGVEDGDRYDNCLAFRLPLIGEGDIVNDVHLRLNEQGGSIGSSLTLKITGARHLDPLGAPGGTRFFLPRTTSFVEWTVSAAWDSSGQRIAKWEESPDLSGVLNEIFAQSGWGASTKVAMLFLEVQGASDGNFVRYDDTHAPYWDGGNPLPAPRLIINQTYHDAFLGKELLCRPTPTSVEVNIIPHASTEAFVEWGDNPAFFENFTMPVTIAPGAAQHFLMDDLTPDSRVYYRLRYRKAGQGQYKTGTTHNFLTLPEPGEPARICFTTDMHVTNTDALGYTEDLNLLSASLQYMSLYQTPDAFHVWFDLGDLVVIRAMRTAFDAEEVEQRYQQAREYIDLIGHSLPFVLVRGNHEEVNGWDLDGTAENTAVWSGLALLKYFPPPLPDDFYSGNTDMVPHLGLPGNYFAFDIGNLRMRCLDPYLYSLTRPHNGHGETGGSLNGWDWSLGLDQYLWLENDLAEHPATFRLVAIHHLTSCYTDPAYFYGRGGIEIAKYAVASRASFEWGGEDSTGANVYATMRPDFIHGPVHDVLRSYGVHAVLKGHDHFYARQRLQGVYYVTFAKPDDTGNFTGDLWGWRWNSFYPEGETLFAENSGFVSLEVGDTEATFSYVQSFPLVGFGNIRDAFTLPPAFVSVDHGFDQNIAPPAGIRCVAPNPARQHARVDFTVPSRQPVTLTIHDIRGSLVRRLASGTYEPGEHHALWDGRDQAGRPVASGVYFTKLVAGNDTETVKVVILH
jgi:hypothetical protein